MSRRYRNVTLAEREEHPYRPVEFDGDEIPHPVRWETLERKYLVIVKAAEVAAVTGDDRGPMVECIQHPEWGRMVARDAARHGANTSTDLLMVAVRTGRMYAGLHWCKAGSAPSSGRTATRGGRRASAASRPARSSRASASSPPAWASVPRPSVRRWPAATPARVFTTSAPPTPARSCRPRGWCRPVLCVETGRLYPSVADAARAVGCNKGNISSAAARGNRAAGLHWRYPDLAAANKDAGERAGSIPTVFDAPHPHSGLALSPSSPPNRVRRIDGGSIYAQLTVSNGVAQEGTAA
jgi:hypothetical protein